MKTLRCFLMALVLSFSLSTAAIAGDIQTVGFTAPPPPPPSAQSAAGDMQFTVMLVLELLGLAAIL